jgi:hypothetical protein
MHLRNLSALKKALRLLSFFSLIFLFDSCLPLVDKPVVPVASEADWLPLSVFSAQQNIKTVHATPFELYFLSNDQFFRLDANQKLIEKRPLATDRQLFGTPVLSDNTFLRISQGADNKQILEFHLTRNPASVRKIIATNYADTARRESFDIDFEGRTPGAYSSDGTKYFLPGIIRPSYKPVVLILDIKLDGRSNEFVDISLVKRVEITGLATEKKIEACRFINGNFYLATKDGGFRITPQGDVKKLFSHWTYDFFAAGTKIYSTGFNSYDFQISADNGNTFQRSSAQSPIKFVETANGKVFSQTQRIKPYEMADSTLLSVKPILYNSSFTFTPDPDYEIDFFQGNYYINLAKNVYYIPANKLKIK